MSGDMTRTERSDLQVLVKRRAKASCADVDMLAAQRRAEVEASLSKIWSAEDEGWADYLARAQAEVEALNARIKQECDERGIPKEMQPYSGFYFEERGSNSSPSRRVELRKKAYATIEASAKAAKAAIGHNELDVLGELIAGGLESEAARTFLRTMPTAGELMPSATEAMKSLTADLGSTREIKNVD